MIGSHLARVGRLALMVALALGAGRPARAAPPDARPPSAELYPYFGWPGRVGSPSSFTDPAPGVYAGTGGQGLACGPSLRHGGCATNG